jgi:hypothetical protein
MFIRVKNGLTKVVEKNEARLIYSTVFQKLLQFLRYISKQREYENMSISIIISSRKTGLEPSVIECLMDQ